MISTPPGGEQVDILLVDDQPAGLLSLEATLEPLGQTLHRAQSGREALRMLLERDFALILLDVLMPGMDGFETARIIRERERTAKTPIIFLTALSDGVVPRLRAYAMGAVDYLIKPYEPEVLRSKASVFIELARKTALVRRQAQALHDAQARQHERELIRTREEFLAAALHELRTPLTSLNLQLHSARRWVETQASEGLSPSAVLARIGELEGGVQRLSRLSDYLLDISRMREGKLVLDRQLVDLSELVREVVERHAQSTHIELHVHAAEGVIGQWDRARLDQVLSNLVSNAIKYGDGKPVDISVALDADTAILRVQDRGVGIAPQDQARIFERFSRAHSGTAQGFGLGLWIVQQLVTQHGGTVTVQSEPGVGSTFTAVLPRVSPAGRRDTPRRL